MTTETIGIFILGLLIGTNIGVGAMCLLNANGPSAHDAIWHLSQMFYLVENANMCDFTNGVTYNNIDEGTVIADRVLDNARRFLLRYGDGEQRT